MRLIIVWLVIVWLGPVHAHRTFALLLDRPAASSTLLLLCLLQLLDPTDHLPANKCRQQRVNTSTDPPRRAANIRSANSLRPRKEGGA